jgi:hexosaminidase
MHNITCMKVILLALCPLFAVAQWHHIIPQPVSFRKTDGILPVSKASNLSVTIDSLHSSIPANTYSLKILADKIAITAASEQEAFYALNTLHQLLHKDTVGQQYYPCADIIDSPRYAYRAMHIDVCRHFFPVTVLKQYLDTLAAYKLNYLHLHLTDDQGWRMEIIQYPALVSTGAWRTEKDGSRYGGYYTQKELKELVQYAAARFITIIPEIEIPGHSTAAIAAYPFLSCHGDSIGIPNTWGIKKDIYCPTDSTFQFIKNVLDEVCAVFPSAYIHLGGDEAPKAQWRSSKAVEQLMQDKQLADYEIVQRYFMQEIQQYLHAKGRQAIGWGEVMRGGADKEMIVMSWIDRHAGIKAAKRGNRVIMAPRFRCYFDYPQSIKEPLKAIYMTYLPLRKVYNFIPESARLTKEQNNNILGGEATVWTERIATETQLHHQIYPRIAAMAEALWGTNTNYNDFKKRLDKKTGGTPSGISPAE